MKVIFDGDRVIYYYNTPTWESVVPMLLAVYEQGGDAAKENVRKALERMAQEADKIHNNQN